MNKPPRTIEWLVWGGLVLITAVIGAAFVRSKMAVANVPLPVIGQIPDFHLTNQDDQVVTSADLRGKVWVADLIFTRCPGQCRVMSAQFEALQAHLPADGSVRLVSFTSDPSNDTPPVLKKFAGQFNSDPQRWCFLTGKASEIHDLEVNGFKFVAVENKPGERSVPDDWFSHSIWYGLVDQQGRMRGWFDSDGREHATFESDDPETPARLQAAIQQLLRQPLP